MYLSGGLSFVVLSGSFVVLSGIHHRWPRKPLNLRENNNCAYDIHECVPCSLDYLMKWHMNACACIRDQR